MKVAMAGMAARIMIQPVYSPCTVCVSAEILSHSAAGVRMRFFARSTMFTMASQAVVVGPV